MTEKEKKKESGEISRREFLKDAGLVVGGAAIGSTVLLAACGGEETTKTVTQTKTVTETAGEVTKTVTTTAGAATVTETVSKFVCPFCSTEFTSLSALTSHVEAAHEGEAPVALNVVTFTVNGYKYEMQVEPNWTLQELLHDKIGWTSIKSWCLGFGACGSCTAIVDGRPIISCMMLAIDCDGVTIETSEGLGMANHPLIEAYVLNHCMQCGYCTPGFIITAKALLDRNPNPTEADIVEALSGNICRCGTQPRHIPAVLAAAEELGGG